MLFTTNLFIVNLLKHLRSCQFTLLTGSVLVPLFKTSVKTQLSKPVIIFSTENLQPRQHIWQVAFPLSYCAITTPVIACLLSVTTLSNNACQLAFQQKAYLLQNTEIAGLVSQPLMPSEYELLLHDGTECENGRVVTLYLFYVAKMIRFSFDYLCLMVLSAYVCY